MNLRSSHLVRASVLVLSLSLHAFGDDEKQTARELFRGAETAFDRGDYRAAALGFEAANEKSHNGGTLFNAAVAWERAPDPARAADDFSKALASGELDEKSWAEAKSRRAALERKLCVLTIQAPPDAFVSVAHVDKASAPVHVHLLPGTHVAHAHLADGRDRTKTVEALAGTRIEVDFGAPESSADREPRVSESGPAAPAPPPAEQRRDSKVAPPWAWIAIGSGVAIAAVGGYLRYRGYQANRDFNDSNQTDADAHDRAIALRTWSGVALIGGAALAATGVVLLIVDNGSRKNRPNARLEAVIDSGLSVRFRHF